MKKFLFIAIVLLMVSCFKTKPQEKDVDKNEECKHYPVSLTERGEYLYEENTPIVYDLGPAGIDSFDLPKVLPNETSVFSLGGDSYFYVKKKIDRYYLGLSKDSLVLLLKEFEPYISIDFEN